MNDQAVSFFVGFIQDTNNLKILLADYNSFFVNMSFGLENLAEETKKREEINKRFGALNAEQKAGLLGLLNNIRRIAFSLQIDIESLKENLSLSIEEKKRLEENYKEIEEISMPDYKKCKAYLQEINNIKVKNINVQLLLINREKEQNAKAAMQNPKGSINERE